MPGESFHPEPARAAPHRGVTALALAIFALLAVGNARAAAGWSQDYDYPGHGVGWYGAKALYELRRDFPIPVLEQATDGDDFGRGYEPLFDRYGFGPPAQSTDVSQNEYIFRFGSAPIIPYGCSTDADCSDYVFCNGTEQCTRGGSCIVGTVPSCDDLDPCTDDVCDWVGNRCSSTVLTAAHEVQSLILGRAAPASSVASLSWQPGVEASSYHVYRSTVAPPGAYVCFQTGIQNPFLDDDGLVLLPGRLMSYLVTAVGCGAEGSAGTDWRDRPRSIVQPCP